MAAAEGNKKVWPDSIVETGTSEKVLCCAGI